MNHAFRTTSWRARLEIALWRHGWLWPVVFLLAAATAAGNWLVLQPGRTALAATHADLALARAALPRKLADPAPLSEQRQLTALQHALRHSPEPAQLVREMAALAQAEQIVFAQGEYQQQVHATTQVTQVLVTQPIRAAYPQLRRYIESVLRTIPNASLDQMAVRRENVGQSQLEVRLRWSFWTLPAPTGETARNTK